MKTFRYLLVALCGVSVINTAFCERLPNRTKFDNRIKKVVYNADDVVRVNTRIGYATLIKLSKGEVIDSSGGLATGDPQAWNVNVRENNIFLRPIAEQPDTNLTIVTNKRTYFLNLKTVDNKLATAWGVEFIYPEEEKNAKKLISENPCLDNGFKKIEKYNYQYLVKGQKTSPIMPISVYDNNVFTCVVMPNNANLPSVFKKYSDKSETMTNYHVNNNVIIIHELAKEFRLRLGKEVIGIKKGVLNNGKR